jgi:hypothetical protein
VARILVLWTHPHHLSAEDAQRWALEEASRLLSLDVIERAELTRLRSASGRHPGGWDWLLELHLAESAERLSCVDAAACAEWLADLDQLGLHPTVLLANGGVAPEPETR